MKISIVLLLVALSCCFDIPAASKTNGKQTRPARPNSGPISNDCIIKLLQSSLPNTLIKLQEMLCYFSQAKKANNIELYKRFLTELHQLLKDVGCTGDQLLQLEQALEKVGDEVGKVCYDIVLQILTCVEDLGITEKVFDAVCKLAGDILLKLADALKGLDLKIVTGLTSQIGVGGKGGLLLGVI